MTHGTVLAQEPLIRLGIFFGVLAIMVLWESARARRARSLPRRARWPSNLGIVALDTLIVRLLFPTAAVGVALLAEQHGWGLLNSLTLPSWAAIVIAIIILDLTIYGQHALFHAVPLLWRVHRVHHSDLDFDATTGLRFHPIEICLSMAIKLAAVTALGAPALGVLIFEVLLSATSLFNHGNVAIPASADRVLRWLVVTPDMHRVHHSVEPAETNSNFGFNLPWWDRIFGTYRAQPGAGHAGMTIGLRDIRDPAAMRLDRLLLQPFRGRATRQRADHRRHAQ